MPEDFKVEEAGTGLVLSDLPVTTETKTKQTRKHHKTQIYPCAGLMCISVRALCLESHIGFPPSCKLWDLPSVWVLSLCHVP